jgi:spore germination cell wall hydrolase CwlJ-like protein
MARYSWRTVGEGMATGHIGSLFGEILHRDETRPSPAMWFVRLALIALALSSLPSSMLNVAGEKANAHSLSFMAGSKNAVPFARPAAFAAGATVLKTYGEDPVALLRPAPPFHFTGSANERSHAIDCLAAAGWYEAGDDPDAQRSVMQVVLNRVRHPAFPSSVCAVVFEGSQLSTGCQFTFTCDGSLLRRHPAAWEMARARKLAADAIAGAVDASVGQATHYHADYVSPWWSPKMQELGMVGLHVFYRWPGRFGLLTNRGNAGPEPGFEALADRAMLNARVAAAGRPGESAAAANAAAASLAGSKVPAPEVLAATARPIGSALFMAVDPSGASGGWAVAALGKCAGRRSCEVVAYQSAEAIDRNSAVGPPDRERPLFLFVRDAASGMEVALWDCARVSRPSASQCLPADAGALAALMKERPG